ncbi:MAG: ABC transporter ATP-binding protein [Polyangiaceae bacterium]|nr:ABC transporter ATP-binding protein [Polyangiaceae bacterium]
MGEPAPALRQDVPKLELVDLSVSYRSQAGDSIEAVRDVSLAIADKPGIGEIVVLLGPSGCGKSTILKCVAGLISPTKGEVLLDGQPIQGLGRDRGMVFQSYTSFAWLTVLENVAYGLRLQGIAKSKAHELAMGYIELVGLKDFAMRYPKELSGGMKQRVAIARTLINRPKLLLMDEPFGALDPHTRWDMQGLLLDISRKEDNTIILVTHDVTEAVYVGDTAFVLTSRPARILKRCDIPHFQRRDLALKSSSEFRATEQQLLDALYAPSSPSS